MDEERKEDVNQAAEADTRVRMRRRRMRRRIRRRKRCFVLWVEIDDCEGR
jgi:hypothetical protein